MRAESENTWRTDQVPAQTTWVKIAKIVDREQLGAHVPALRVRIARQAANSHLRRKLNQFHLKQGF